MKMPKTGGRYPWLFWTADLPALSDRQLAAITDGWPEQWRRRVAALRRPADRLAVVASRLLWLYGFRRWRLDAARCRTDGFGKPYLPGGEYFFNISHSDGCAAAGFDRQPIGVDIEVVTETDLSVAGHYFAPVEVADLQARPAGGRLDYFFWLWTLKESYIKADGRGMRIDLSSFSFRCRGRRVEFAGDGDWQFQSQLVGGKYRLAVCRRRGRRPARVVALTWQELTRQPTTGDNCDQGSGV
ncbi:MAG: 4'-phosphopantetheinyl transferase superfamily protein [Negativicutes bacterium]|nr:4'-phosphopantetheinyl transferase superfamily protein [Negativicutes bacterium]